LLSFAETVEDTGDVWVTDTEGLEQAVIPDKAIVELEPEEAVFVDEAVVVQGL